MIRSKLNPVFVFLCLVFLVAATGGAAERKSSGKGESKRPDPGKTFGLTASKAPIDITSDTVEADQKQNRVTFKGNVVAKQEEMTLLANVLVIDYDTENKGIKTAVASGNVKITHLERRATGQKITFFQHENKVVLEGDAVIREGDNIIRGDRVTYFVDEEKSIVEGGKGGRVNTTITPPKKD